MKLDGVPVPQLVRGLDSVVRSACPRIMCPRIMFMAAGRVAAAVALGGLLSLPVCAGSELTDTTLQLPPMVADDQAVNPVTAEPSLAESLAPYVQEAQLVLYRDVAAAAVQLHTAALVVTASVPPEADGREVLWQFYQSELSWLHTADRHTTEQLSGELYRLTVAAEGSRPYLAYWILKARLWQDDAIGDVEALKQLLTMREQHWPGADAEWAEVAEALAEALARTEHLQAEKLYLELAGYFHGQGRETESRRLQHLAREQQQLWQQALEAGFH